MSIIICLYGYPRSACEQFRQLASGSCFYQGVSELKYRQYRGIVQDSAESRIY